MLNAGHRRTDFLTGAGGQRRAEHMPRCVRGRGAGENDRLAVKRIFHQREDFLLEAELACRQDRRRVALVRAIHDQCASLIQAGFFQDSFIEIAVDHSVALFHQAPCIGGVFLDYHRRDIGLLQLGEQRCHRRAVVKYDDVVFETGNLFWQTCFETLLEERNQVDRKDQKNQKHADKLNQHNIQHHERVIPIGIPAVARRG